MLTRTATCQHYWIVEAQNGPTGTAICKLCGEVKTLCNSIEALDEAKKLRRVVGFPVKRFVDNAVREKQLPVPAGLTGVVSMRFYSNRWQHP